MCTRHDDTARQAIRQARYRLRSARDHATLLPHVPARVIGEVALAREELATAQDAVDRRIDQEADRAEDVEL